MWSCTITSMDSSQFIVYVQYNEDVTGASLIDQFIVPMGVSPTYITDCISARLVLLAGRDTAFSNITANKVVVLNADGTTAITSVIKPAQPDTPEDNPE